jgi:hypothetical protein
MLHHKWHPDLVRHQLLLFCSTDGQTPSAAASRDLDHNRVQCRGISYNNIESGDDVSHVNLVAFLRDGITAH